MFTSSSTTITANTCQPWPFTSFRLRSSESITPLRSITTTGAASAQIVIRKSPGTIRRTNPMPMAMPATMPVNTSVRSTGRTDASRLPTVWSRRPSMMSWAASTTMPWNQ